MQNNEPGQKYSLEYIYSLPLIKKKVMGVLMPIRYDSKNKIAFMMNNDGAYAGRFAHVDLDEPQTEEEKPMEIPQQDQECMIPATEESAPACESVQEETEDEPADTEAKKAPDSKEKKKIKKAYLVAIAVIAVVCIICGIKTVSRIRTGAETGAPSTEETTLPVDTIESTATENTTGTEALMEVSVLSARTTILPGHILCSDDFEVVYVADIQYRNLCASGGIYTGDDVGKIEGMAANTYIPAGTYLRYDVVSPSYSPVNPWGRTDGQQANIIFPVTVTPNALGDFLFGNRADVTLTVQTKVTAPSEDTNAQGNAESGSPVGIEHNSSTVESMVVDTYIIRGATIIDALDAEKNSLYSKYHILAAIPAAFQEETIRQEYETLEAVEQLLPSYIVVALPADQATVLNALDLATVTVEISNVTPEATTDRQSNAYAAIRAVADEIGKLWVELNEQKEGD